MFKGVLVGFFSPLVSDKFDGELLVMASFQVFNLDVVATGVLEAFAASFPVSTPFDVWGEVIGGATDYKGELLRVDFKGDCYC